MNKGICFYFGFMSPIDERAKLIKDAGFDCVIANADEKFNCQNDTIENQVKVFDKYNLKHSSLHMRYNKEDLPAFWTNSKLGDDLEQKLVNDIEIAAKYHFTCVVIHTCGTPSEIGLNRYRRILKVAEKYNIPLAFENINNDECFHYVMKNLNHPLVKFCYDIGHQHCFYPNVNYLEQYGDKLITLHLHSNNGSGDMHTLNKYGTVDWKNFAKQIAKINPNINLDYEILMVYRKDETLIDVLAETIKQANELEQMILNETK